MTLADLIAADTAARRAGLGTGLLRKLAVCADLEAAGGDAGAANVRDRLHHDGGGNWKRIVDDAARLALIEVAPDPEDGRRERLRLREPGRLLLAEWRRRVDGAAPIEPPAAVQEPVVASMEASAPDEPPPVASFDEFAGDTELPDEVQEEEPTGDAALLAANEREQAEREESAPVLDGPLDRPPAQVVERRAPVPPARPTANRQKMVGSKFIGVPYGGRPIGFSPPSREEMTPLREPPGAPRRNPPGVRSR
jgi:hypothetical protein